MPGQYAFALNAKAVFDLVNAAKGLDSLIKNDSELKSGEQYPVEGDGVDFPALKFSLKGSGPQYLEFDLTLGPL